MGNLPPIPKASKEERVDATRGGSVLEPELPRPTNGGRVRPEQLDVEAITLCRMLDRMEEAGLLERRRDPADRRAWRVHLTEAGQALLPQLRDGVAPMVETMLAGLDPAERERFGHLLEQVRSNLTRDLTPEVATHG